MIDLNSISKNSLYVIDSAIDNDSYVKIDLSVNNSDLLKVQLDNPEDFQGYIDQYLKAKNALAAYGGYNERRNLYRTSTIFSDSTTDDRDLHIGMDLWAPEDTAVLAVLDGKIHSFQNNLGKGNYGPTIILEHQIGQQKFYSLYGHLSVTDLANLEVGAFVTKGEKIAELGSANINGGYPPHLHFQLILDIGEYVGDYPGVCTTGDSDYLLQNCPDPNLLLKIEKQ